MHPLVSVIIPLYNGEKYIEKCLDSILAQHYTPLEIVIVNDESRDDSVACVTEYGKKKGIPIETTEAEACAYEVEEGQERRAEALQETEPDCMLRLFNQKNRGQGAARNTGIRYAKGQFLMFADQDDTLNTGVVSKLVQQAISEQADIVTSGYRRVTPEGAVKQEVRLTEGNWSRFRAIAPWGKLYSTEFIKKNDIRFLPVVLGEDIYFLMQAYSYRPKVAISSEIGYNWLDNAVSVSNTAHKELNAETSLLRLYDMLEELKRAEVLRGDDMYEYFLIKTAVWDILYTARGNAYESILDNEKRIWEWFEEHFPRYKKNPYLRITRPEGEAFIIRLIVWGYMLLKGLHLEKLFLKIISRRTA